MQSFRKTMFSIANTTHWFKTLSFAIKKRQKELTNPNAHLETGLWLFVYECVSQPSALAQYPEVNRNLKNTEST
jgi:hypothetical protein